MKTHLFLLMGGLLPLLLAACQFAPSANPSPETPEKAKGPAISRPTSEPFGERYDEKTYPKATAVLWADGFLWTANESGLLTRWDVNTWQYQQYRLPGEPVIRVLAGEGQAIYAGTDGGDIWCLADDGSQTQIVNTNEVWKNLFLTEGPPAEGAPSRAIAGDNNVWVAAESYIVRISPDGTEQVYEVVDNPVLLDRIRFVVLDDKSHPWFVGRRGKIHFDGQTWIAYDADIRHFARFTPVQPPGEIILPPRDFPAPTKDYVSWLKTWPRPEADNGRGIHFLQTHRFDAIEAQKQVNRLRRLGMRWALVHYVDHEQLVHTAPIFQEAGITVVWRPFVRPYETYESWAEDVEFLRSRGLAPYIQLYNEPSLAQEWVGGQPIEREVYLRHLLPAAQQVYDAGGYVGLQFIDPDWLRLSLQTMKAQGMSNIFDRLFLVPHLYGLNHPPAYDEDINGVLGFREFAHIFKEEIGFIPVMIAGEGGWRPGEAQDNRYPVISEELHRDYHLAVFDWFRTGKLANRESLPDYFLAFCPWLISDPADPAAWFDSASGDRVLTIEAIEAMLTFERNFSWDE
jgi:hypothetical protein